ncbi:hypothetical protein ACFX2H_010323 [Malus domestica]
MKLPPGHPQSNEPNVVCKLHKAIYGLKQSPRAWYAKLSSVLISVGFKSSNADSSLFIRTRAVGTLVVLIYVDDLIITGDNTDEISTLKQSLRQRFAIKDLGILKYFLGIEVATSHKGLFLNQRKYVLDLLKDANMSDAKPTTTPLDSKQKPSLKCTSLTYITHYQRLVGKLIYLTITRPDITYSVSLVSQFMHSPTLEHLTLVKRILRYLKGSVGRGIIMRKNDNTQVVGYCDADWAGNTIDRVCTILDKSRNYRAPANAILSRTQKSSPPTRRPITTRHVSRLEANQSAARVDIKNQSQHDTCQCDKATSFSINRGHSTTILPNAICVKSFTRTH